MKKILYLVAIAGLLLAGVVLLFLLQRKPPKPFDLENPLALEVTKVRSYYHAIDIQERLEDMGLRPYVVAIDDSIKGGKWYKILVGAKKDSAEIASLKKQLQEKYRFKEPEIVDYQSVADKLVEIKPDTMAEKKKIKAKKPHVPQPKFTTKVC